MRGIRRLRLPGRHPPATGREEVAVSGKEQIRKDMLAERRRRETAGVGDAAALVARLIALPCYGVAGVVAGYLAVGGEVDLAVLIGDRLEAGLPVWLPRRQARS